MKQVRQHFPVVGSGIERSVHLTGLGLIEAVVLTHCGHDLFAQPLDFLILVIDVRLEAVAQFTFAAVA